MAFNLTCPSCDSELSMKKAPVRGKKVTCPECEHRFVPGGDEPEGKSSRSSALLWLLIGGGALGLLLVLAAAAVVVIIVVKKSSSSGGSSSIASSSDDKGGTGGWSPAAKYRDKLGKPGDVIAFYQIDTPTGYQANLMGMQPIAMEPGKPSLMMGITSPLTPEAMDIYKKQSDYGLQATVDSMLQANSYKNVKKGNIESGSLAGGTFYRVHFTATNFQNKKMTGFYYVGICGKDYISISCYGDEPATEDAVNLLEAAALTLRRK